MTNNANAGHKLASLLAVLVAALPTLKAGVEDVRQYGGAGMKAAYDATDAMDEGFGRQELLARAKRYTAEHGMTNQTFIGLVESVIQEWTEQIERESAESDSYKNRDSFDASNGAKDRRRQSQNVNRTHIL